MTEALLSLMSRVPPTRIGARRPFRHFIEEWMKKRDLTQLDLAVRMECSTGTVSKLISGKMALSSKWMAGLAAALEIEVRQLFEDPQKPSQNDLLEGLTPAKREQIIRFAEFVRKSG